MAELFPYEEAVLRALLPIHKPGYAQFFARLLTLPLERGSTLQFGQRTEHLSDLEPIATGELVRSDGSQEAIVITADDDRSAFQVDPGDLRGAQVAWSYSSWTPGDACPKTHAAVREISQAGRIDQILVLSPTAKTVWLHDTRSGYNKLLSITGMYQHLLQILPGRVPGATLSHNQFFVAANASSDQDLREALVRYNHTARLFSAESNTVTSQTRGSVLQRILHWFRRR